MAEKIIEINNLKILIQGKTLLEVDQMNICKGDIIFINGKNGSGKTTFLKVLSRRFDHDKFFQYNQDGVKYHFNATGDDITNKHVIYLNQNDEFRSKESIYDALYNATKISIDNTFDRDIKDNKEKLTIRLRDEIENILTEETEHHLFFDLLPKEDKFTTLKAEKKKERMITFFKKKQANQLSGGQKKLLSFLQAYIKVKIMKSAIFILDEPLNNIDLNKIKKVSTMIENLIQDRQDEPLSIIIVSHLMTFGFINRSRQYAVLGENVKELDKAAYIDHSFVLKDL